LIAHVGALEAKLATPSKALNNSRLPSSKGHRQLGDAQGCRARLGWIIGRMTSAPRSPYAGYRFPAEIVSYAVWLYFRFPLSLRMVEYMLAARGIAVGHETVRQWALKFGQAIANRIRRRQPQAGDKWHLDEVVLKIAGVKHWLWRAVDQTGVVLDVLVQSRRDKHAAKRLLRKLSKKQMRPPRVTIADKLASYGAAKREIMPGVERRQHIGSQQSRRKLAPAHPKAGAANEALQVTQARPAFSLRPRRDRQSLPPPPSRCHRRRTLRRQDTGTQRLGRGQRRHGRSVIAMSPCRARTSLLNRVAQVDGAIEGVPLDVGHHPAGLVP
jgi:putative transposase